jgi:hypothetical protein
MGTTCSVSLFVAIGVLPGSIFTLPFTCVAEATCAIAPTFTLYPMPALNRMLSGTLTIATVGIKSQPHICENLFSASLIVCTHSSEQLVDAGSFGI